MESRGGRFTAHSKPLAVSQHSSINSHNRLRFRNVLQLTDQSLRRKNVAVKRGSYVLFLWFTAARWLKNAANAASNGWLVRRSE